MGVFGMNEYDEKIYPKYFLQTVLRFSHSLLKLLEKYSSGKVLKMKTNKLEKNAKCSQDESEEAALAKDIHFEEQPFKEKDFNFKGALADFSRYEIIENVLSLIQLPDLLDNELIEAIAVLFNRIVTQLKGTYVFYQLDTLNAFNNFICEYKEETKYVQIRNIIKKILKSFFER